MNTFITNLEVHLILLNYKGRKFKQNQPHFGGAFFLQNSVYIESTVKQKV